MKKAITAIIIALALVATFFAAYHIGIRTAIDSAVLVECSDYHAGIMFGEFDEVYFAL